MNRPAMRARPQNLAGSLQRLQHQRGLGLGRRPIAAIPFPPRGYEGPGGSQKLVERQKARACDFTHALCPFREHVPIVTNGMFHIKLFDKTY